MRANFFFFSAKATSEVMDIPEMRPVANAQAFYQKIFYFCYGFFIFC
jgi:hypothetical protein